MDSKSINNGSLSYRIHIERKELPSSSFAMRQYLKHTSETQFTTHSAVPPPH